MIQERVYSIIEELQDVETIQELEAIWCHWEKDFPECANDPTCMAEVRQAAHRLKQLAALAPQKEEPTDKELDELLAQLDKLKAEAQPKQKPPVKQLTRGLRKYQLLKTDVSWSTKPQVQAIMHILSAHMTVGEVLDEVDIVEAMIANEAILETRQGGKRIWDYYKGDHMHGLSAHGNVRKI